MSAALRIHSAEGDGPQRPDPVTNYVTTEGGKYQRARDVADIAKDIRRDIAQAIRAGRLPTGLKVSVTIDRFSMGQAIDLVILAAPGVLIANPPRVRWDNRNPHAASWELPEEAKYLHTEQARGILGEVESIASAYQRSTTEAQTDYHATNFFLNVRYDHALDHRQREAIAELQARGLTVREKRR